MCCGSSYLVIKEPEYPKIGTGKPNLPGQIKVVPLFINKVLLEYGQDHSFTNCLLPPLHYNDRVESLQQTVDIANKTWNFYYKLLPEKYPKITAR